MKTTVLRIKLLCLSFGLLFSTAAQAIVVSDYGVDPKAEARRQARLEAARARGAARLKAAKARKSAKSSTRPAKKKVVARKTAAKPKQTAETIAAVPATALPKAATESTGRPPETAKAPVAPVTAPEEATPKEQAKDKKIDDVANHTCTSKAKADADGAGNSADIQKRLDKATGVKGFLTPKSQDIREKYPSEFFSGPNDQRFRLQITAPTSDGVSRYQLEAYTPKGLKILKVKELCVSDDRLLVILQQDDAADRTAIEIKKGSGKGQYAIKLEELKEGGKSVTTTAKLEPRPSAPNPTPAIAEADVLTAQ